VCNGAGEGEPAAFDLFVGRENWTPSSNAEILARYGDGGAAVVRNRYGMGMAVSFGFYAGLEYAADILRPDYDTSVHFTPLKRRLLESVLQQAGIVRPLEISHPLVEGLRLRHPRTGEETIVLMNWSYRGREGVPLNNVELCWHGERSVSRVKSTWFQEWRQAERQGDDYRLVLPRLEDGDILIVE